MNKTARQVSTGQLAEKNYCPRPMFGGREMTRQGDGKGQEGV